MARSCIRGAGRCNQPRLLRPTVPVGRPRRLTTGLLQVVRSRHGDWSSTNSVQYPRIQRASGGHYTLSARRPRRFVEFKRVIILVIIIGNSRFFTAKSEEEERLQSRDSTYNISKLWYRPTFQRMAVSIIIITFDVMCNCGIVLAFCMFQSSFWAAIQINQLIGWLIDYYYYY